MIGYKGITDIYIIGGVRWYYLDGLLCQLDSVMIYDKIYIKTSLEDALPKVNFTRYMSVIRFSYDESTKEQYGLSTNKLYDVELLSFEEIRDTLFRGCSSYTAYHWCVCMCECKNDFDIMEKYITDIVFAKMFYDVYKYYPSNFKWPKPKDEPDYSFLLNDYEDNL